MARSVRTLLDTVMQALPEVGNLGLLFFLLFYIFAALGVELFGRIGEQTICCCHCRCCFVCFVSNKCIVCLMQNGVFATKFGLYTMSGKERLVVVACT